MKWNKRTDKENKMNRNEIEKRWKERIVANGWDKMGAEGAKTYLEKYGKKIADDKLLAFADYATELGLTEFANEFKSRLTPAIPIKEVTLQYAVASKFNDDAINQFNDGDEQGGREVILFETTVAVLAANNVGSLCGDVPNHCFKKIATKFPDVEVRGCLDKTANSVGCVDMKVVDEKMGEEISELADNGRGSLRFDGGNGQDGQTEGQWEYFETE